MKHIKVVIAVAIFAAGLVANYLATPFVNQMLTQDTPDAPQMLFTDPPAPDTP